MASWRFDCITVLSESMFFQITVNFPWPTADLVMNCYKFLLDMRRKQDAFICMVCRSHMSIRSEFKTSDGASSISFGVVVGVRDFAFYSLDHPYAYCKKATAGRY